MHKRRSHTQQRQRNMHLACKPAGVIPSTRFMTKHDNEWEDILGYWCIYQKTIIQVGPLKDKEKQSWSKRWNIEMIKGWQRHETGSIMVKSPQRTVERGMEQWHPTPNCSYNYQTANTKTSIFMITGPKHWQRRIVISQEIQEAQKDKSENMPNQKRKEIRENNKKPP